MRPAENEAGRLGEGRPGQRGLADKSGTSITPTSYFGNSDLQAALDRARDELGLVIKFPITDGRLHRVPVDGGRPGNLDGAYRICLDAPANVWAMNYKTGAKGTFSFGGQMKLSPFERRELAARVEDDRRGREAEQRKAWDMAAQKAERIYSDARHRPDGHPYLTAKGVKPHFRLRVSGRDLIAPLYDSFGVLRSLQFIDPAGQKRFLKGGRKSGCSLTLDSGKSDRNGPLLICEGVSTGLSLLQATGFEIRVAFDASNLRPVAMAARKDWPSREIILAADNDAGGGFNVGLEKGREAALAIGGKLAVPFFSGKDRCAYVDFNDVFVAEGAAAVKFIINMAFEPGKGSGHVA